MMTLREALVWIREQGPSIELELGASGEYGPAGQRIQARALLAALDSAQLAAPVLLTWDTRHPGDVYLPHDALGWIHTFTAPGKADQAAALWVMQREEATQERGPA